MLLNRAIMLNYAPIYLATIIIYRYAHYASIIVIRQGLRFSLEHVINGPLN